MFKITHQQVCTCFIFYFVSISFLTGINAQEGTKPMIDENVVFGANNGVISVEAEHFYKQSKNEVRSWYRKEITLNSRIGPKQDSFSLFGAGNDMYIEALPDTRITHDDPLIKGENFSNEAGVMAILHYKIKIDKPGRYYVWVRAFSSGNEDNSIHVGIDGQWPESGQRLQWCKGKNNWYWESKQRTKEVHCGIPHLIYLDIDKKGVHDVQFSMREDGFKFDRFLLTLDKNYIPIGTRIEENLVKGKIALNESETVKLETSKEQIKATTRANTPRISGELKKWHKVTLTFNGPETSETDEFNPFMNYRLTVTFIHRDTDKSYTVPGYFAADGNAGETSAAQGDQWKVHFAPDEIGTWRYLVSFRKGSFAAITSTTRSNNSGNHMDGAQGSFVIEKSNKTGRDFRGKGRLQYVGERYLKFTETDEYFLKVGPDAPENFLAYADFDGTFHNDGHKDELVKTWEPHLKHWQKGDPTWKNGKGKAMIGALNYLVSKKMNVFSFLTFNIGGDDQNVFPFVNYDTLDRFDVSKLDQWEKVFEHAQKLGLFLHFKLSETENQGLLDNGAVGAKTKLYYRELIARFGHHLALNWNIGEENGEWEGKHKTLPMDTSQRLAAATALYNTDPYNHHIVIHNGLQYDDVLGPGSKITGPSIQTHKPDFSQVHDAVLEWIEKSKKAGKQWAVAVDEPGDARHSLLPDAEDPEHNDARKNGLWGAFMAGAWGTEWYFGYQHAHSDLTCQDYTSRDLFWDQCRYVLDFFKANNIHFWETENRDHLVDEGNYCLAKDNEFYIVYLKKGKGTINLKKIEHDFSVKWFDPRNGGELQDGEQTTLKGGTICTLDGAPTAPEKDWVVLIRNNKN